jgi:N-methylhydantoinase A/oxoprolinase/acetone carboxylase beta subunit
MIQGAVDAELINRELDELAAELVERLERDGASPGNVRVERALDCRYVGQGYELRIPIGNVGLTDATFDAFHRAHRDEYGHAFGDPIEIVNLRVTASGERPKLTQVEVGSGTLAEATLGEATSVWRVDGELVALPTRHLLREKLPIGEAVAGPAVVFQRDTTIVVPPGWSAVATAEGVVLLTALPTQSDGKGGVR